MNEFRNTKILVVGGAGFVGSNLVMALLGCEPREVLVVDNLLSAESSNVPDSPAVRFVEGSITNDAILRDLPTDLDYAFHLATFHGNQNSMADPLADHENNTLTTLKLYERLRHFSSLKRVVYSSAGCTVAEKTFDKANATTEDAPVSLWLDSPYQISKIIGEYYSNYYFKQHKLPVVKARFQNVYGPREILGAGKWRGTVATIWRNVIPTFVYQSLKQMALPVENGGIASRDFIYAEDVAQGLMCCATRGTPGGTYNIASGQETTIFELANLINDLTGNPTAIAMAEKRPWDRSGKRYGATETAKSAIGFAAKVDLNDGLERTIAWTRQNLARIEACMSRHSGHLHAPAKAA
ncbi:MAG: NAD-dependent epimerase/dehydratase family protein [Planctomycetes bacterium]|nr:NAD-dependent epimerase/dehydratase family protein [Planctomycetota bacterium]